MIAIVKSKVRKHSHMVPDVRWYKTNDNYITLFVGEKEEEIGSINLRKSEVRLKESLFDDEKQTVVFGVKIYDDDQCEKTNEGTLSTYLPRESVDKIPGGREEGSAKAAFRGLRKDKAPLYLVKQYREMILEYRRMAGINLECSYDIGVYNGLEKALAMLDGRNPNYIENDFLDKEK